MRLNRQAYVSNQQRRTGGQSKRCSPWCLMLLVLLCGSAVMLTLLQTHSIQFEKAKLPSLTDYIHISSTHNNINPSVADTTVTTQFTAPKPKLVTRTPKVPIKKRKRYAYAITITKDGFFQDGAAVLVYSIMKYSWNASYDISFVAFVHPNVTTSRPGLQKLGFHVIEVPIPINATAIKFDFLREKINKNGCCGASELIKLTSYR